MPRKTLIEQWEQRLREYETRCEQMRHAKGAGGTGTVADEAQIRELRRCIRELKEWSIGG